MKECWKVFNPTHYLKSGHSQTSQFFGKVLLVSHRTIQMTKNSFSLKPRNFKGIVFNESLCQFTLLTKPQILKWVHKCINVVEEKEWKIKKTKEKFIVVIYKWKQFSALNFYFKIQKKINKR